MWWPGTDFGAQPLTTSGALSVGAALATALTISSLGLGVAHVSAGGAISSSLIVNADIDPAAAIAVTKLAAGANGTALVTVAGVPTWAAPGGDLSGSYPSPTVAKINATTITTAGGALTTGAVLRVTGAATADWGALNLANASAVTGNLPIGNIAPSGTNGQALITTAGVAAWGTNFGAQNLVTTGVISLGTNPSTTIGDVRLPEGGSIAGRNAANTANQSLFSWAAGVLTLGANPPFSRMTMNSTNISLFATATAALVLGTTGASFGVGFGVGFAAPGNGEFGTLMNASVGGTIRYQGAKTNWAGIAANTGGTGIFSGGSCTGGTVSNTGGDAIVVPGIATGTGPVQGTVRLQDGAAADQATVTAGAFNVNNVLTIGSTPATAGGHIRLPTGGLINARNAANSADVNLLSWSADVLFVGAAANSLVRLSTLGTLVCSSTTVFQWGSASVTNISANLLQDNAIGNAIWGGLTVSTAGYTAPTLTIKGHSVSGTGNVVAGALTVQAGSVTGVSPTNATAAALTLAGGDSLSAGSATNVGGNVTIRPGHGTGTGAADGTLTIQDGASTSQATVTSAGFNVTSVLTMNVAGAGAIARFGLVPGSGTGSAAATGVLRMPMNTAAAVKLMTVRLTADAGDAEVLTWTASAASLSVGNSGVNQLDLGSAVITNVAASAQVNLTMGGVQIVRVLPAHLLFQSPLVDVNQSFNFGVQAGANVAAFMKLRGLQITTTTGTNATTGLVSLYGGECTGVGATSNTGGPVDVRGGAASGAATNVGNTLTLAGGGATTGSTANTGGDVIVKGGLATGGAGTQTQGIGRLQSSVATDVALWDSNAFAIPTLALRFGLVAGSGAGVASAAAAGLIRIPRGIQPVMSFRNETDTADIAVIATQTSAAFTFFGDHTAGTVIRALTNVDFQLSAGVNKMRLSSTSLACDVIQLTTSQTADALVMPFPATAANATGVAISFIGQKCNAASGGTLVAGTAGVAGGDVVSITTCTNATGGAATLRGGDASTGTATNVGGNLTIRPGRGTGTGAANGALDIQNGAGTSRIKIDTTGIGFFAAATVAQPADMVAITDSTTGTPSTTLNDGTAAYSQAITNNNNASILTQINKIRTALRNLGLMA